MNIDNFGLKILESLDESRNKTVLCLSALINAHGEDCLRISGSDLRLSAERFRQGLAQAGLGGGDRIIVASPPSSDLYALLIACFVSGVVPVLVDQRYALTDLKALIHELNVKCILGPKSLLQMHWLVPSAWKLQRYCVDGSLEGCKALKELSLDFTQDSSLDVPSTRVDADCVISCYEDVAGKIQYLHSTHQQLIDHLGVRNSDPLLVGEGVFASDSVFTTLFQLASGQITLLPTLLPSSDSETNKIKSLRTLYEIMQRAPVTSIEFELLSLQLLVEFLVRNNLTMYAVQTVFIRTAKIPARMFESCRMAMPNAKLMVAFYINNAGPICAIEQEEFLQRDLLEGYLVGAPLSGYNIKIVKPELQSKNSKLRLSSCELGEGQAGEIVIQKSSLPFQCDGEWFKSGDYGFKDRDGNLWLTGNIGTLIYWQGKPIEPYPIEQKVNRLEGVTCCAFIQYQLHIALILEADATTACELRHSLDQCIAPIPVSEISVFIINKIPTNPQCRDQIDRVLIKEHIEESRLHPLYGVDVEEDDCCGIEKIEQKQREGYRGFFYFLSMVALIFLLKANHADFTDAIFDLVLSLALQIPIIAAVIVYSLWGYKNHFRGQELFEINFLSGSFKLNSDTLVVAILIVPSTIALYPADALLNYLFGLSPFMSSGVFAAGLIAAAGYIAGNLICGYFAGKMSHSIKAIFDRYQYLLSGFEFVFPAIAIALLYYLVLGFRIEVCMVFVAVAPYSMHFLRNYFLSRYAPA